MFTRILLSAKPKRSFTKAPSIVVIASAVVAGLLAGCVSMPVGPTVAAMPPPNKPFEVFVQDDQVCRNWATASISTGRDAGQQQMLASTLAGAALGTLAGALAGGHHDVGTGAAIGTLVGAGAGADQGAATAWTAQRAYDVAYQQCMYARGNVIPGYYPYPVAPPPPPPR
ncbi:MAG: glycine zipper family protein [Massilia sp.]|nr:glycine zipper family protein [Massilia sp.]